MIPDRRTARAPRGLTLLELVVVMTILVALAGILIPMLPNFLNRATISSCTTNLSELAKLIQTYQTLYIGYPDQLDNFAGGSGIVSYVLNGQQPGSQAGGTQFDPGALTAGESAALISSGITQLASLVDPPPTPPGDWSPTFWPYSISRATTATLTPIGNSTSVAVINFNGATAIELPTNNNEKYVIFGLGAPCTLFHRVAMEPVHHFPDNPNEDPTKWYKCFGMILLVSTGNTTFGGSGGTALDTAKFMGVVAFDYDGMVTISNHTQEWWDHAKADQP